MKNRRISPALFWLTPLCMFVIAETVTGNLFRITPICLLLNMAVYYFLYTGAYVLAGSSRISYPVLNLLIYALAAGEYFVISFRERPVMVWDALALRTAMTVSGNYKFALTLPLALCFLAAVLLAAGSLCRPRRISGTAAAERLKAVGAWAGCFFCFLLVLFQVLLQPLRLDVHMWDPIVSFEREGFLLSTVISMKNLFPERPDGYSRETEAGILTELEALNVENTACIPESPANVICIMNESFSDLGIYNGLRDDTFFETDQEYLSFFHSLSKNAEKGKLFVPVFGAMTANTEYEFLTGNACAFVPQGSIPYQLYTKPGEDSLARIFGENGYRTVAMHPYPGYNWNRTKAYAHMGFSEFLDLSYFDELGKKMDFTRPRGYMSDCSNYDGIIHTVRTKKPGEKLFLFNVTMQNHGGYEVDGFPAKVRLTRLNGDACAGTYPKTEQYLTLLKMSDDALRHLISFFEEYDEPTMIVLFGDHQPSVEISFYEAMYGARWSEVPESEKITSFVTPYLIWTNYTKGGPEAVEGRTSESSIPAFLLGNRVLKAAGIELAGYRLQLERIGKRFQAVHSMGTVTKDGMFTSILEMDGLDSDEEIHALHILQYGRMFQD